jgi:hypothetical protein
MKPNTIILSPMNVKIVTLQSVLSAENSLFQLAEFVPMDQFLLWENANKLTKL